MRFEGKVVVVTGAGSGIGRATAEAFATEGARVHAVDRLADRVGEVVAAIAARGGKAVAHTADLSEIAQVERLADEVYAADGRVDVLHNNAGVGHGAPIEECTLADWKWVLDANLWTVIHGLHAFLPRMRTQGGPSHIVNTASGAGLYGIPGMAPYCTSKFAVVGLSESLAAELAPIGISVTAVCPGLIKTRIVQDGRIRLPGKVTRRNVEAFYERFGATPELVAKDILNAVEHRRSLQLTPMHARVPWWVKRVSSGLYQVLARDFRKRTAA